MGEDPRKKDLAILKGHRSVQPEAENKHYLGLAPGVRNRTHLLRQLGEGYRRPRR